MSQDQSRWGLMRRLEHTQSSLIAGLSVTGCWFHFANAIMKRVHKLDVRMSMWVNQPNK